MEKSNKILFNYNAKEKKIIKFCCCKDVTKMIIIWQVVEVAIK